MFHWLCALKLGKEIFLKFNLFFLHLHCFMLSLKKIYYSVLNFLLTDGVWPVKLFDTAVSTVHVYLMDLP